MIYCLRPGVVLYGIREITKCLQRRKIRNWRIIYWHISFGLKQTRENFWAVTGICYRPREDLFVGNCLNEFGFSDVKLLFLKYFFGRPGLDGFVVEG